MSSLRSTLAPHVARWLTSETRVNLARVFARLKRRGDRVVHYVHRVDDPYCQLLVQVIPDLMRRFDIKVYPHVVERLNAAMYPDPHRYEAMAILDCGRLAKLYGLGFPREARVPDRLAAGMATRYLAALEGDNGFFEAAETLGEALWRWDLKAVREIADKADMGDQHIRTNERLLASLGHWSSGALIYEGEAYPGLARLDHLERRLNGEGAGDGRVRLALTKRWAGKLGATGADLRGHALELFFSVRSPYSYLALEQCMHLVARSGVSLLLRPIMPMVTRGQPLPAMKRNYIVFDSAREARALDIPFGRIADPIGAPVEQILRYGLAFAEDGDDIAFFRSAMQNIWALGNNGLSESGLTRLCERAGLSRGHVTPLDRENATSKLDDNLAALLAAGSWGVPTFRVGPHVLWGQDQMWAAVNALLDENQAPKTAEE